jgi:acetyl-CoA decarbonylase/synthase complex subunit gamma
VLVTANYKLSFDRLRSGFAGRPAWVLVLDTKGINVWCAAGKGSFGTEELVRKVDRSGLRDLVNHRRLILPQLGAPGVAAHRIRHRTGFQAVYGPVRAEDLPAFLDRNLEATAAMRRKTFSLSERAVLVPVELVSALKLALPASILLFLLGGLGGTGPYWHRAAEHGGFAAVSLFAGVLAGAVLTPLLLPWLPGRAFSLKGLVAGGVAAALVIPVFGPDGSTLSLLLEKAAWFLLILMTAAFLGMNFTGASTYTSLSGVRREMRWAVPLQIGLGVLGLLLWAASRAVM